MLETFSGLSESSNLAMITVVFLFCFLFCFFVVVVVVFLLLLFLRTNNIRDKKMYSAIKSALILFTLHVQGRNVHRRGAMTCLCESFGEKVGQHEMTMCDFCLRGYLSSIKRHGLPKHIMPI